MPMPRRHRRPLALFALALALFAALPCSMLAGERSCCGAATKCADAAEAPCAQLAAAPCCEARSAALQVAVTAALPPESWSTCPMALPPLSQSIERDLSAWAAGYAPPLFRDVDAARETIILRL